MKYLLIAQLVYDSRKLAIIKYSLYYANYRYKLVIYQDLKDIESILIGVEDKARLIQELYEKSSKNIAYRNLIASKAANK